MWNKKFLINLSIFLFYGIGSSIVTYRLMDYPLLEQYRLTCHEQDQLFKQFANLYQLALNNKQLLFQEAVLNRNFSSTLNSEKKLTTSDGLELLVKMAKIANLKLINIKPLRQTKVGELLSESVVLELLGDERQWMSLIDALDHQVWPIRLTDFEITREENQLVFKATVDILHY